jgi:hypothetical protein
VGGLGLYIVRNVKYDVGGEPNQVTVISNKIANGDLRLLSNNTTQPTSIFSAFIGMRQHLRDIIQKIPI